MLAIHFPIYRGKRYLEIHYAWASITVFEKESMQVCVGEKVAE